MARKARRGIAKDACYQGQNRQASIGPPISSLERQPVADSSTSQALIHRMQGLMAQCCDPCEDCGIIAPMLLLAGKAAE